MRMDYIQRLAAEAHVGELIALIEGYDSLESRVRDRRMLKNAIAEEAMDLALIASDEESTEEMKAEFWTADINDLYRETMRCRARIASIHRGHATADTPEGESPARRDEAIDAELAAVADTALVYLVDELHEDLFRFIRDRRLAKFRDVTIDLTRKWVTE